MGVTDSDLCLAIRYQKHVHTYRILPDGEDFLAVQVGPWTLTPDFDSSQWLGIGWLTLLPPLLAPDLPGCARAPLPDPGRAHRPVCPAQPGPRVRPAIACGAGARARPTRRPRCLRCHLVCSVQPCPTPCSNPTCFFPSCFFHLPSLKLWCQGPLPPFHGSV